VVKSRFRWRTFRLWVGDATRKKEKKKKKKKKRDEVRWEEMLFKFVLEHEIRGE